MQSNLPFERRGYQLPKEPVNWKGQDGLSFPDHFLQSGKGKCMHMSVCACMQKGGDGIIQINLPWHGTQFVMVLQDEQDTGMSQGHSSKCFRQFKHHRYIIHRDILSNTKEKDHHTLNFMGSLIITYNNTTLKVT